MYYGCTHAVIRVISHITSCTSTPLATFLSAQVPLLPSVASPSQPLEVLAAQWAQLPGATLQVPHPKPWRLQLKWQRYELIDTATAERKVNALCTCTCPKESRRSMASVHSGVSKRCRVLYISLPVGVHQVHATNSSD